MEAKTKILDKNIVREGENPSDVQYVSPEVALAQAGKKVDFSMHVNKDDSDTNA